MKDSLKAEHWIKPPAILDLFRMIADFLPCQFTLDSFLENMCWFFHSTWTNLTYLFWEILMRGESCPKSSICDVDQAPVVHIVYIYVYIYIYYTRMKRVDIDQLIWTYYIIYIIYDAEIMIYYHYMFNVDIYPSGELTAIPFSRHFWVDDFLPGGYILRHY